MYIPLKSQRKHIYDFNQWTALSPLWAHLSGGTSIKTHLGYKYLDIYSIIAFSPSFQTLPFSSMHKSWRIYV